ncbi:ATP-binding cassette domain-containing protein [Intrasporangium sp.]|uniref:ABC transporter ATP-binding protein n=1 Tax=Intrasporangium sp. TaxID=1925024 RepID=UPI0032221FAD
MRISAVDVGMRIDNVQVITGESLVCEPGTMTALVGPSGSGKTTFLHCLGLLQRPTQGSVLVDDADTIGWNARRVRRFWRDSAAFVIQDYGIIDDESVAYNVTMTSKFLSSKLAGDLSRCAEALDATGLSGRGTEPASHLSGGEKQRLAIARAIYKQAEVVYVDEPTASLDAANRHRVVELFLERAAAGCTVVVATHDEGMMAACSARHLLGSHGSGVRNEEMAL